MKKLLAALFMVFGTGLSAQTQQNVMITMPPGSGIDTQARLIMKRYTEVFGTNALITNRPGAEGVIGLTQALSEMPPDTLLFPSTGHVVGLGADLHSRVEPLIEMLRQPFVIIVRKNFPANNFDEFISYARANPGKVSMGMGAKAMSLPIVLEWERRNNIKFNHVFYGGATQGRGDLDVATGALDVMMNVAALTFGTGIEDRVKIIAITSTVAIPGVDQKLLLGNDPRLGSWYVHQGIYVNSSLNSDTKRRLNAQFNQILQSQWARESLARPGVRPTGGSQEDFARANKDAWSRWQRVETK